MTKIILGLIALIYAAEPTDIGSREMKTVDVKNIVLHVGERPEGALYWVKEGRLVIIDKKKEKIYIYKWDGGLKLEKEDAYK